MQINQQGCSLSNQHGENEFRTIKLILEYDGTDFAGWQIQPNQRTIQDEIEKALKALTQETIRIVGSGRTDAGVHALGQVASFQCASTLPVDVFRRGLNALLPGDIRILSSESVNQDYHARFHAVNRTYQYVLLRQDRILFRRFGWYTYPNYSITKMQKASEYLLGEHSWHTFAKIGKEDISVNSTVLDIQWHISDEKIIFEITAERFFRHMIRLIMGTLLEVGRGKRAPEQIEEILKAEDIKLAGPKVPPHGLFLLKVQY